MKKLILLFTLIPSLAYAQLVIPPGSGGSGAGSGTVTSVAMTVPAILTVTGSPITGAGTLAVDTATTPTGTGAIVLADSPTHTTKITIGGAASPGIVFDGNSASDSDGYIQLISDSGGTDNDILAVGPSTTLGTTPLWRWPLTTTLNNKTSYYDVEGAGTTTQYQRLIIGPNGTAGVFSIEYRSGTSGTHRILRLGTSINNGSGSYIDITNSGSDSTRMQCFVNAATRTWCAGSSTEWYPNADNQGSLGIAANAVKTAYVYHYIGASTVAPSIAGNATLNTGASDAAGKITSTGTGSSTAVITFGTAYARAPACYVNNETTANLSRAVTTTTTLTVSATVVTSDVLSYMCMGY